MNGLYSLPPLPHKSTLWSIFGLFILLGFLLYGHTLSYDFVRWDDGLLIYENPAIRGVSWANLTTIFTTFDPELYIPITLLSYQIDFLIGGTNASIYHCTNLLLHICNALLVTWLLFLFLKHQWIAIFLGIIFLIHPLHTEAVVWASARKDLLSTFFVLLSLLLYLYHYASQKHYYLLVSIAAFALALMSKVTVVGMPVILALYHWQNHQSIHIKKYIPYIFLSCFFGVVAIVGKTSIIQRSSLFETLLMSAKSTIFYLEKLFIPIHLSVLYPYIDHISLRNADFLLPVLLVFLIIIIGLWSIRIHRSIPFGLAIFFMFLVPSFTNFAKGDNDIYFASDRYAYAASIGILLLIGIGLSHIFTHSGLLRRRIATLLLSLWILIATVLAYQQSRTWENSKSLFANVLAYYPDAYVAHTNLGNTYLHEGNVDQAISSYEASLRIKKHPRTYSNLGSALRQKSLLSEAEQAYQTALSLDAMWYQAHLGLGIIAASRGNIQNAEQEYRTAIEIEPSFTAAYINLGSLFNNTNRHEEAIEVLKQSIETNPFYPQSWYNLGLSYRALGRNREALESFEEAIALQPSFIAARINAGILYAERQNIDDAIFQFSEVLKYDPNNTRALSALQQLQ